MENNNVEYDRISSGLLKTAIISACICWLPIGSIIAIVMANRNLAELHSYLNNGGLHTPKIKASSATSKGGKYGGIGFTILWGVYFLFFIMVIVLGIAFSR